MSVGGIAAALLLGSCAATAQVRISGRITNETGTPVAGARITVAAPQGRFEGVSDPTGNFAIPLPTEGAYSVTIDREGFFVHSEPAISAPAELRVTLLTIHELRTAVDVTAPEGGVDMDRTAPQTTLSGRTLFDVPFPNQNSLRSGMRMIPGVVQDSRGEIHLFGGAEDQAQYTFEGFQLNDPLTGRFDARMSLEAVESIDVTAGRPGAEYGRGAAGSMAVHARTGGDKFRYSATNIFPSIDTQRRVTVGNWTPRGNVSGPWQRGKAWFSSTTELQYTNTLIPELPPGQDRTHAYRANTLLHNQVNLSNANILYVGLLFNFQYAPRSGLTFLDPRETTVDRRARQWFGYVKDQHAFSRGALVELGYAASRTISRETPQGSSPYVITPFGRSGNSYANSRREAARDQIILNGYWPSFRFLGEHRFKTGADAVRVDYYQNILRSGIRYVDVSGAVLRSVEFRGPGRFDQSNYENSLYVQDSWRMKPDLLFELGLRMDHDQILGNWNPSPRIGFAWSPPALERLRIAGGVARIFDATNMRLFTRPLDQVAMTTYFAPDGAILRGPVLSIYRLADSGLPNPQSTNWNLSAEQRLEHGFRIKAEALRRQTSHGFAYRNSADPDIAADSIYVLTSRREDQYHSVEFAVRQSLRAQHEWMASYTRSVARSQDVLERSIDQPLQISSNAGPQAWDTPNRMLSWGFLPTPSRKWSIAYLAEWRSGFPFSVQDQTGRVIGPINDHRFPRFFEADLFAERAITFWGYHLGLRGGFYNLTNHKNPNVVNNVEGGPNYLLVYGGQSRALNFRLRILGRN